MRIRMNLQKQMAPEQIKLFLTISEINFVMNMFGIGERQIDTWSKENK